MSLNNSYQKNLKNTDERMLETIFHLEKVQGSVAKPRKKIAIISTQRSGSTFFCQSLGSTGLLGNPDEWFSERLILAYQNYFRLDSINMKDYLNFIINSTTSANGIFSVNIQISQYIYWKKKNFDLFSIGFDHIVYVYRRSKIEQALSFAKAIATDQWLSKNLPKRIVPVSSIKNSSIIRALNLISSYDEFYEQSLKQLVEAEYCYEDFTSNPDEIFSKVLNRFGIEMVCSGEFRTDLKIQRGMEDFERLVKLKKYLGFS